MSRPTHVIVGAPVDCKACGGTGETEAMGFEYFVRVDGTAYRPCPECRGATFRQYAMTLEEFAKLFTYGQTIDFVSVDGHSTRRNEIRVRVDDACSTGPQGKP